VLAIGLVALNNSDGICRRRMRNCQGLLAYLLTNLNLQVSWVASARLHKRCPNHWKQMNKYVKIRILR